MVRFAEQEKPRNLSEGASIAIEEALEERIKRNRSENNHHDGQAVGKWKLAIDLVIHRARTRRHYLRSLNLSTTEHMSSVDPFDGSKARKGQECAPLNHAEGDDDLLVISPEVDGRMRDVGREADH